MGFARSLCNTKAKLAMNRTINKNLLHTSLLQKKGDNNEIIIYDR